jgi:bifunctional UDP-N-acetylglucosamine pyrophosphorylase/glucosamine-1-phosphate N-acetyltransferase
MTRPVAAIILAAGKGTRMKSDLHKVLHPIAGRPMLAHLLASVGELSPEAVVVVAGHGREQLEGFLGGRAAIVAQEPQLGTGHAVWQTRDLLLGFNGNILILYGDVPFVRPDTMREMLDRLDGQDAPAVVVLGFEPEDPLQYGRIIATGGQIQKMVEHKDATIEERDCRLCNSGLMAVQSADLFQLLAGSDDMFEMLAGIGNDNAAGEYYLIDIVNAAVAKGRSCAVVVTPDPHEVEGINSRAELAVAEVRWQVRRRTEGMADGASLVAPETVWFSYDTKIGRDVLVEPNVFFGPGVTIGDNVKVRAFSHIEGATIETGAEIGPYARLRPGAEIGEGAKVGNFVEVKKAKLGKGAKASHLTYLGDAEVGAGANIGAGTITCNYDGWFKYRTTIGEGAFIGSNSALVAPVTIGKGALVAAGSVITRDVPEDAVALARGAQVEKPGRAAKFRAVMTARKKQS